MAKSITSPIAGQVIQCLVKVGDLVQPDTEIAIVEAMKMHIPVSAEQGGSQTGMLATVDYLIDLTRKSTGKK